MSMSSPQAILTKEPGLPKPPRVRVSMQGNFWRFQRASTPYLFLAPFLALFLIFLVYPLYYSFNLSLYRTQLVGGTRFVGADNYVRAFHDPYFWEGVRNMLIFGCMQIPVMLGLALIFALVLDSGLIWLRSLFRLGFFLPFTVPTVVAALMWGYLYGNSFGLFAQIARFVHQPPVNFLSVSAMLPSIGNITVWQYAGYNMLILYAALQAVPQELYEAAYIDGASAWQVAFSIKVPLIAPALILTGIFSIIGTLQLFTEPQVMYAIAPTVINGHYTPNYYAYQIAFSDQQFDYSAAIAFTLGIVTALLSSLFLFITYRRRAR